MADSAVSPASPLEGVNYGGRDVQERVFKPLDSAMPQGKERASIWDICDSKMTTSLPFANSGWQAPEKKTPATSVVRLLPPWSFHGEIGKALVKYWVTVEWKLAHRIQTQMAAIEILEDVAYWARSDALSNLVGDADTFSRAAQYLAARLRSILPEEPEKGP